MKGAGEEYRILIVILVLALIFFTHKLYFSGKSVEDAVTLEEGGALKEQSPQQMLPFCNRVLGVVGDGGLEEGQADAALSAVGGLTYAYNRMSDTRPYKAVLRRAGRDGLMGTSDDTSTEIVSGVPTEVFEFNPHYGPRARFAADPNDPNVEEVLLYARLENIAAYPNTPMLYTVIHGGSNKRIDASGANDDVVYDIIRLEPLLWGRSPIYHDIVTGNGAAPKVAWNANPSDRISVIDGGVNNRIGPEDEVKQLVLQSGEMVGHTLFITSNCFVVATQSVNNNPAVVMYDLGDSCMNYRSPLREVFTTPSAWSYDVHAAITDDGKVFVYGTRPATGPREIKVFQNEGRLNGNYWRATVTAMPDGWYLRSLDVFYAAGIPTLVYIIGRGSSPSVPAKLGFIFGGNDYLLGTADDIIYETHIENNLIGTIMQNIYVNGASGVVNGEHRIFAGYMDISSSPYSLRFFNLGNC